MNIDTATTAGKIAIMQAYERGEEIQCSIGRSGHWDTWIIDSPPSWDWKTNAYRIKPRVPREFTLIMTPGEELDYLINGHDHKQSDYESGYKLIKVREVIE
jgi:hypothetical protein